MPNRLANSTSPYLQQHASNPVHWHEWGAEALQLARETQKPILLSIGYSACHWCHVMAHESFEDADMAALMNTLFINIKVDREERPDIDQIYQSAHALLTQRTGGWPLTMFLTPDTTPFFGGTYFPKTARYGLPGFGDLLTRVETYFRQNPVEIRAQNAQLILTLNRRESKKNNARNPAPVLGLGASHEALHEASHEAARAAIDTALHDITDTFDSQRGGFGQAPKFPHPEMIEFCLRRFAETDEVAAKNMACFTLEQMCKGGIYDQIGGGFARYSVDNNWAIPHFEKMLYDNGPLLRLLVDAFLVSNNNEQKQLFARVIGDTANWIMREMQSPDKDHQGGGYYASLDADSEGHEGKFYVWTPDEIAAIVGPERWPCAKLYFGLDRPANFEGKYWNLIEAMPLEQVAHTLKEPYAHAELLVNSAKEMLLAAREKRSRPARDEKILVSWNAMMIEAMAHAARVVGDADYLISARKSLAFIHHTMWDAQQKRLYATHKDGKTHLNAYLDDYAYLLKAILEVIQADFNVADLTFAQQIADVLLDQFEDTTGGGFYFTSHDHEPLIQRPKPGFDNATPSGNGVAALALLRLGHLTNEAKYAAAAERTLHFFADAIDAQPSGHGSLLMALEEWLTPTRVILVTGPAEELLPWKQALAKQWLPTTITLFIANDLPHVPTSLARPVQALVSAYVCEGTSCLPAITSLTQLRPILRYRSTATIPPNPSTGGGF